MDCLHLCDHVLLGYVFPGHLQWLTASAGTLVSINDYMISFLSFVGFSLDGKPAFFYRRLAKAISHSARSFGVPVSLEE